MENETAPILVDHDALASFIVDQAEQITRHEANVGKRFQRPFGDVVLTCSVVEFYPKYAAGDRFVPAYKLEPVQVVPCDEFLANWTET